jgi:pentatricopeptide repeat protein
MASSERTDRSEVIRRNNEISRLSSRKDLQGCQRLYEAAVAEKGGANTHTYCAMINAYIRCGDMSGAVVVFDDLKKRKFEPDVVSYTTMIKGYCQLANDIDSALKLFEEMILISSRKKTKIFPNIRTVNTILRGCVNHGKVSIAENILGKLKEIEVAPDISSWGYITLVHSQHLNLQKLLPMVGRISTGSSDLSMAAIHANVARVASILCEWRICRKFLKSAEAFLASASSNLASEDQTSKADEEDEENDLDNQIAVGGKQSWKTKENDENRELSLHNYRLHQLEETKLDLQESRVCLELNEHSPSLQLFLVKRLPILVRAIYLSELSSKSLSSILASLGTCCYRYLQQIHELSQRGLNTTDTATTTPIPKKAATKVKDESIIPFPADSKALQLHNRIIDIYSRILSADSSRLNIPALFTESNHMDISTDDISIQSAFSTRMKKLEICSGTGEWIVAQAVADPAADWISLELRHDRVFRTLTRAIQHNLSNLCILQGDATIVLPQAIDDSAIDHIFINHPEPPQQTSKAFETQAQHLLSPSFFFEISRILRADGLITILTDNLWYARYLMREISSSSFPTTLSSVELQRKDSPSEEVQEWQFLEESKGVHLYQGKPGLSGGHVVDSSSYFDR